MGTQILDVYHGRKVFSLNWNEADAIDVVAFKPGQWRQLMRASGDKKSGWPDPGTSHNVTADGRPTFVTREFLQKGFETMVAEIYAPADIPQQSGLRELAAQNDSAQSTVLSPRVSFVFDRMARTLLAAKVERTDDEVQ